MLTRAARPPITVAKPRIERLAGGRWRLSTSVAGRVVSISGEDLLAANADAWVAMLLLPAAKAGVPLQIDADLDETLQRNVPRILGVARQYWGFRGTSVGTSGLVRRAATGGSAMFFTGGVDSFFTLRRRGNEIERLIFVNGFDIGLDDVRRFAAAREWIDGVARLLGIKAAYPTTDLKTHPMFHALRWGLVSHGAALATVAHAMAPLMSRVFVASTDVNPPWGSTPELDPLWSSGAVEIVNDGSEFNRLSKVRAIADWEPVHRYLKVCISNQARDLNCGACEKCVRTQLAFAAAGALDRLQTFPSGSLIQRIDDLPYIPEHRKGWWREVHDAIADRPIRDAIDRCLARRIPVVDWLQQKTEWLRRSSTGRVVRRLGGRLITR